MLIEPKANTIKTFGTETRCGDCQHFKKGPAHEAYAAVCSTLGKKVYSVICQHYTPDISVLNKTEGSNIAKLAALVHQFDAQQLRILSHCMSRKAWFERAKVEFGQQVYFCLGESYLSNYVRGYVIGVTKDADTVHVISNMEALQKQQAVGRLLRSSVLTDTQFEKIRSKLIKSDRVMEPESTRPSTMAQLRMTKKELKEYTTRLQAKPDEYRPPSIDTVPAKWLDKRALKSLKDPKNQVVMKGSAKNKDLRISIKRK